jgi:putative hydrolase of the HAD superfamily
MEHEVGIPKKEIPETRDYYWKTYGTTLEGLKIHHQTDPEHYLTYVHDIPLDNYLQEDPILRDLLSTLPQSLWVFTNADGQHAERVLEKLNIADLFEGIVDLIKLNYDVKPNPSAYQGALRLAGEVNPTKCVLFDDLLPNLITAKNIGFTTTLVGKNGGSLDSVDYYLESIHEIRNVMPTLWNGVNTHQ